MITFFKDKIAEAHFLSEGYVVLHFEDIQLINELNSFISLFEIDLPKNKFFYSLLNYTPYTRLKIRDKIKTILDAFYKQHFENFTSRNESFLSKPSKYKDEMYLHQDWTYTDIKNYISGTLWIPLQDVNEENGCVTILPKSHILFNQYISSSLPTVRIPFGELENTKKIEMTKGQALLFNPLVFHGSFPNNSLQNRNVITSHIFTENSPYIYISKINEYKVKICNLEEDEVVLNLQGLIDENIQHLKILNEVPNNLVIPTSKMINIEMKR
jgi:ectoine hydroxylase-related dioxygenase (phytanoyl-CoA dioxygenase family)